MRESQDRSATRRRSRTSARRRPRSARPQARRPRPRQRRRSRSTVIRAGGVARSPRGFSSSARSSSSELAGRARKGLRAGAGPEVSRFLHAALRCPGRGGRLRPGFGARRSEPAAMSIGGRIETYKEAGDLRGVRPAVGLAELSASDVLGDTRTATEEPGHDRALASASTGSNPSAWSRTGSLSEPQLAGGPSSARAGKSSFRHRQRHRGRRGKSWTLAGSAGPTTLRRPAPACLDDLDGFDTFGLARRTGVRPPSRPSSTCSPR